MNQNSPFWAQKSKKISGEGCAPSTDLSPCEEGDTPSHPHLPWRLDPRAYSAQFDLDVQQSARIQRLSRLGHISKPEAGCYYFPSSYLSSLNLVNTKSNCLETASRTQWHDQLGVEPNIFCEFNATSTLLLRHTATQYSSYILSAIQL